MNPRHARISELSLRKEIKMLKNKTIPIFYACDDGFVKYTAVSIRSIIDNASREYKYHIYILNTGISERYRAELIALEDDNFKISLKDVSEYLDSISDRLPVRDYYTKTTYYRLFIAEMYPEYDKAIYIDSDTIVCADISELYGCELYDAYVGACHEQVMIQVEEYGNYVEKVVGVSRYSYFNAGVLLLNCRQLRRKRLLDKFVHYLGMYNFVVTQDEDYLNLICRDHVLWLDERWNTEVFGTPPHPYEEAKILHYIMTSKPWHYSDCTEGERFWEYARKTAFIEQIQDELDGYTDEKKAEDARSCERLLALAVSESEREDNFLSLLKKTQAADRVEVMDKIALYEREGRFDVDVEADPPSRMLMPDEIDYIASGPIKRLKTKLAFGAARKFVYKLIEDKKLIVKEICGLENFRDLDSGAVITCNHFNAYDSFAMQIAYEAAEQDHRTFFRVIREGNYTSFPGFYGRLMRNCNTLPLSSNPKTMRKFMDGVNTHLRNGNLVLIYPEQSMWWNYRKPKPLKEGAFFFAAKNGVPVLPCFITMKDSEIIGDDGFFIQEYTVHIGKPIYPDEKLSHRENIKNMMAENARVWQEIYERTYSMPLLYTTKAEA